MHHLTKMKHHRFENSLQPTTKQKPTTLLRLTPNYNSSTIIEASQSPPSQRQYPPPLNTPSLTSLGRPTNNHHSTHRPHSNHASVTPSPRHHQTQPFGTNQQISPPPQDVPNTSSPMTSPSFLPQHNFPPYVRSSNYHSHTTPMKQARSHKHLIASVMNLMTGIMRPSGMTPPSSTITINGSLLLPKLTAHYKSNARQSYTLIPFQPTGATTSKPSKKQESV